MKIFAVKISLLLLSSSSLLLLLSLYSKESLNRTNGDVHLTPATAEERAAVEDLVRSTWEADKVGRGADARGLEHSAIQVGWLSYHTTLLEAKWSRVPSAIQVS